MYPEDIDDEELNSLLTTIHNQGEEIAELHKELDKLHAKAEKTKVPKASAKSKVAEEKEVKTAPKKAATKKVAAKKK